MTTANIALSLRQVAEESGLSRTTLYSLIGSGELPSLKIARRRLVLRADLLRFLEGRRQ